MRQSYVSIILLVLSLSACSLSPTTEVVTATATPTLTPPPTPTSTPIPIPTSTPTTTPVPTPTPIPWQKYSVEYGTELTTSEVWMPIPSEWDGVGMRAVRVLDISPSPTSLYHEANGNQIAYWALGTRERGTFTVVFEVELSSVDQRIADPDSMPSYDTESDLYTWNTAPTLAAQSDNPEIIGLAEHTIGDETNPYRQAMLLHSWVSMLHLQDGSTTIYHDALSTYQTKQGDCGNKANLFVALCRALGIPARNVAGLAPIREGRLTQYPFGQHVWAEFYLPDYGWIQCDPTRPGAFARIDEHRIVLSRGSSIDTGRRGCEYDERSFFHTPENREWCGGVGPEDPIWLEVETID